MGLIDKLYLIVFIGAALDDRPDCEDMCDKVLLVAVGVDALLVLLLDLGSEFKGLFYYVFSG
jgi:hypothetical protein